MLSVDPVQFFEIKYGRIFGHMIQGKFLNCFFHGKDFFFPGRSPAQQREEIVQAGRNITFLTVRIQGRGAMPFAHLRMVCSQNQGNMTEYRFFKA